MSLRDADKQCKEDIALLQDPSEFKTIKVKASLLTRKNVRNRCHSAIKDYRGLRRPVRVAALNAYLTSLNDLSVNLEKLNADISDFMLSNGLWDDDRFELELVYCQQFRDQLIVGIEEVKDELVKIQAALAASTPSSGNNNPGPQPNMQKISLPKLELPVFDGTPGKYSKFISQFEGILNKFNISSFEKFSYLEKQLKGPAKDLINSLSISSMDYDAAKDLLDKAFFDNDLLQNNVISDLLNLKMDPKNPFRWISEAKTLSEQVTNYKISSDVFVKYFLWRSLSDSYRQQYIHVTGNNRPTLQSILDQFFDAHARIGDFSTTTNKKVSQNGAPPGTLSLAVGTSSDPPSGGTQTKAKKQKDPKCVTCSEAHKTVQCVKYKSPASKLKRLKDLGRCNNCMLSNHDSANCNFKFAYNCLCGGKHFKFLCPQSSSKQNQTTGNSNSSGSSNASNSSTSSGGQVQTNSSCVSVTFSSTTSNDTILPSFTAPIIDSNDSLHDCRAFLDTCSQSTLIEESFARDLGLKVIESNIHLSLKGINSVHQVKSSRVEVRVRVGNLIYPLQALCVPSIDIDLKISGLTDVASMFKSKGYTLADRQITEDRLHGAKLLLGGDFMEFMLLGFGHFGDSNRVPSTFIRSPFGVLLVGKAPKLLANSNFLHDEASS